MRDQLRTDVWSFLISVSKLRFAIKYQTYVPWSIRHSVLSFANDDASRSWCWFCRSNRTNLYHPELCCCTFSCAELTSSHQCWLHTGTINASVLLWHFSGRHERSTFTGSEIVNPFSLRINFSISRQDLSSDEPSHWAFLTRVGLFTSCLTDICCVTKHPKPVCLVSFCRCCEWSTIRSSTSPTATSREMMVSYLICISPSHVSPTPPKSSSFGAWM